MTTTRRTADRTMLTHYRIREFQIQLFGRGLVAAAVLAVMVGLMSAL